MKSLPPQHKQIVTNRIWRYRKQQQLSQRQVAVMLTHKKTTQVSRWENGEKIPTLTNALKLSCIFKVPVETLFPDLAAAIRKTVEAQSRTAPGTVPATDRKNINESPKQ
jgi:transcriptional regulator with XRE-family HTH domain